MLPTEQSDIILDGPTSVAVSGDWMAVAVPAADKATNGLVLLYNGLDTSSSTFVKAIEVGNLPDMLTFTPDASKVLTANDVSGTVSVWQISEN